MFSPAFSVSSSFLPAFLKLFSPPLSFRVFIIFDSSKGVFYTHRRNTSFSLSFSCSPLPFFPLLFLSSLSSFSHSLSLQIFGAVTAAMPHRFRRACFYSMVNCGTRFVPVTIIIKIGKQFYSMVK